MTDIIGFNGRAKVILADPPYKYRVTDKNTPTYPLLDEQEIIDLHLEKYFDDHSILFLWSTVPKLDAALKIMEAWKYQYITTLVWKKAFYRNPSGYWFKTVCEFLLVGKRGFIESFHSNLENVFFIEPTIHSQKPTLFYEIIEKLTTNLMPKLELFARNRRNGWVSWGNQLN